MGMRKEVPASSKQAVSGNTDPVDRISPGNRGRFLSSQDGWILDNWTEIQKIFQAMNRGLMITDPAGRIVQVNAMARTITGLKRKQILNRTLFELPWRITCPNGLPIPAERMPDIRAVQEQRVIRNAVFGLKRPGKDHAWVGITAAPLGNAGKGTGAVMITLSDITHIRQAEEALQIRNAILEAVSFAAKRFLLSHSWNECIPEILEHLGRAAGVSRTYIFRNHTASDGELMTSQQYEWSHDHVMPQTDNPECQIHYWNGGGMERWVPILSRGDVIHGHVKNFPESEKMLLLPQEIKSMLVVPVRVESEWWGFMGYDDCTRERIWSPAEIDALKTAADTLGVAIERGRLEEQGRQLQENLQNALAKVLSGYLPICAVCKKIRDENNEWRLVESYIRDHSELVFSHGICPECVKKFYKEETPSK
jgi:PAS domain S-box-containing protein